MTDGMESVGFGWNGSRQSWSTLSGQRGQAIEMMTGCESQNDGFLEIAMILYSS